MQEKALSGNRVILLIARSSEQIGALRETLAPEGYPIVAAMDESEAIRRVTAELPDLVILDDPDFSANSSDLLGTLRLNERGLGYRFCDLAVSERESAIPATIG